MIKNQLISELQRAEQAITKGTRANWWIRTGSKKRGFCYVTPTGECIEDDTHLTRINSLVIPPAWKNVRISPSSRSPLQAIGIDTANRVQYLYQPQYVARQQRKKFEKIERFGEHLPKLRDLSNEHIALEGFPKERVLAVMIRLINDLYFRVGTEASVERYRTYGITTLRNRHLEIKRGGKLIFNFVGKHSVRHRRVIVDKDLALTLRDLKALGGAKLFNYLDESGRARPIVPRDVNDYIKNVTMPDFSAKDFRTWGGTLLAAMHLTDLGKPENDKEANRNITKAVKFVSERLGNTPAVCRSSYIHPTVIKAYMAGFTLEQSRPKTERQIRRIEPNYQLEELALINLLHKYK